MAQASSGMGASVLFKYTGVRDRVPKFIEKYEHDRPFMLTDGTQVVLAYQQSHVRVLTSRNAREANQLVFMAKMQPGETKIRSFRLSDFAKTPEFGGKFGVTGDGATDMASASLQYEVAVVNTINTFIAKHQGKVNVHLEGVGTFNDVVGVIGAKQVDAGIKSRAGMKADPKADIIVYRNAQDYLQPDNIFISHKKAGGPEAFQQYGGITDVAGMNIYNHPEVQEFLRQLIPFIGEEGLVHPMMKSIKDPMLKNLSIFGPDYRPGKKHFGLQNVQLIGQGLPEFSPTPGKKDTYTLTFDHISMNGDLSHFTQGYEPVFGATFREGRGFKYKGVAYTGCRVGIYPKALIMNRKRLVKL